MNPNELAASRGAAALDRRVPNWQDKISLTALQINDAYASETPEGKMTCGCVCAQLDLLLAGSDNIRYDGSRFGKYSQGFMRIFGRAPSDGNHLINGPRLGFSAGYIRMPDGTYEETDFASLTQAWKQEIRSRRQAARAKRKAVAA